MTDSVPTPQAPDPATPADSPAPVIDLTVPDPAVSDVHGGTDATDLAGFYVTTTAEVAASCREMALRPTSMYLTSWLYGFRGITVGFGEADTASVDALAGIYGLAPDDGTSPGLYQRAGETSVAGVLVRVEAFCADPNDPEPELAEIAAETPPAVPAPAAPVDAAPTAAPVASA